MESSYAQQMFEEQRRYFPFYDNITRGRLWLARVSGTSASYQLNFTSTRMLFHSIPRLHPPLYYREFVRNVVIVWLVALNLSFRIWTPLPSARIGQREDQEDLLREQAELVRETEENGSEIFRGEDSHPDQASLQIAMLAPGWIDRSDHFTSD